MKARAVACVIADGRFSALQRAENSSIVVDHFQHEGVDEVSVLFSEPKIPQLYPVN